jgi:hypothetical protein
MTSVDPLLRPGLLRDALSEAWRSLRSPRVPDYYVAEPNRTPRDLWLWRLDRIRDTLEQARAVLDQQGWTSGAWFTVQQPSGQPRRVSAAEAFDLRDPRRDVVSSCLVGTLVRLADDPDRAVSVPDAWGCVDELYEAMHERLGHHSFPPGRSYPHEQRRAHLRALTAWNDSPGRTREQVLDLVDRAIARTIVAPCL